MIIRMVIWFMEKVDETIRLLENQIKELRKLKEKEWERKEERFELMEERLERIEKVLVMIQNSIIG